MARSHKIYVVQAEGGKVVAAFTVKHELASWLADKGRWNIFITEILDGARVLERWPSFPPGHYVT